MTTIIEKIVETWPNRAAVRNDAALREVQWEAERPDYPIEMLPFHRHPTFVALDNHESSFGRWDGGEKSSREGIVARRPGAPPPRPRSRELCRHRPL